MYFHVTLEDRVINTSCWDTLCLFNAFHKERKQTKALKGWTIQEWHFCSITQSWLSFLLMACKRKSWDSGGGKQIDILNMESVTGYYNWSPKWQISLELGVENYFGRSRATTVPISTEKTEQLKWKKKLCTGVFFFFKKKKENWIWNMRDLLNQHFWKPI